jgi:hypothetical protein
LYVLDISDASDIGRLAEVPGDGFAGMALEDDLLYVATLDGEVVVFDVSTPAKPEEVARVGGLGSARDLAIEDEWAYVADNTLGLGVLDLSDPEAPELLRTVDVGWGLQDLVVGDGALYAAAGGGGVAVFDLQTPGNPELAATVDYGSSVQAVDWTESVVWAVDMEDVIALDAAVPLAPVPISTFETPQWAMHVAGSDGLAFVADWGNVEVYGVDREERVPDLDLSPAEVYFREDAQVVRVTLSNRGAADLEIAGATVDDARFTLAADALAVEPGGAATLFVDWAGGKEATADLCIATNDPDHSQVHVDLHTGASGNQEAIGEVAPDFTLEDLDGQEHQLSLERGHPVVLVYFATW